MATGYMNKRQNLRAIARGYCLLGHKHDGQKAHPLYTTWKGMIQRCYYPKHKSYSIYGGRGIRVCFRWLNSFENFVKDMGDRPKDTSLDRINTDTWYTPTNCKWSSYVVQGLNRSHASIIGVNKINDYRYRATIGVGLKKVHIGYFKTEVEAYKAYTQTKTEWMGGNIP